MKTTEQESNEKIDRIVRCTLLALLPVLMLGGWMGVMVAASPATVTTAPADWASLVAGSELIVRAHVLTTTTAWDGDELASTHQVETHYPLLGAPAAQFVVHTAGGILSDGVGMALSNMPTLATNEEVLLFLVHNADGSYRIISDAGKLSVYNGYAFNIMHLQEFPLTELYPALSATSSAVTVPATWQELEAAIQPEPIVGGLDYVFNNLKWPANRIEYKVNLNSSQFGPEDGSAADFLAAIMQAADTWSFVPEADFTMVYTGATAATEPGYNLSNDVMFIDEGATDENGNYRPLAVARVYFIGQTIVETDIKINDGHDWDTIGQVGPNEIDLQSVMVHEFGHWLSLGHDPDENAVMYPFITIGTIKRELYRTDRDGINFIYPCQNGQCNPPTPTPTATATAEPTATPPISPTPTATATPTQTPTVTPSPMPTHTPTVTPGAVTLEVGAEGGLLVYPLANGAAITLDVPPHAVASPVTLRIGHLLPPALPPLHSNWFTSFFAVSVVEGGSQTIPNNFHFDLPAVLHINYLDEGMSECDEEELGLFAYDMVTMVWNPAPCGEMHHDVVQNIFDAPICQPAVYGVYVPAPPFTYLPWVGKP